jgi:hypothetical protein
VDENYSNSHLMDRISLSFLSNYTSSYVNFIVVPYLRLVA